YEGQFAVDNITVLGDRTGYRWAGQPQLNYIDQLVDRKLQRIKAVPAPLCTDEEFVRRIYLDLTGLPPAPEQVRAFLAVRTPTRARRAKLVDDLLDSDDYADHWTNKWSDLLEVNRKYLGENGVWAFRNWIHRAVASDKPYDQFAAELLTARGD